MIFGFLRPHFAVKILWVTSLIVEHEDEATDWTLAAKEWVRYVVRLKPLLRDSTPKGSTRPLHPPVLAQPIFASVNDSVPSEWEDNDRPHTV
jgi:hypothetical protein